MDSLVVRQASLYLLGQKRAQQYAEPLAMKLLGLHSCTPSGKTSNLAASRHAKATQRTYSQNLQLICLEGSAQSYLIDRLFLDAISRSI